MDRLVIHPTVRANIAHNVKVKVMRDLRECIGDVPPLEVANILADALGGEMAWCVLDGADQHVINAINFRMAKAYHKVVEPFCARKEE